MLTTTYRDAILLDDPIAYWNLDETSGTVADNLGSVGSSLDATYSGDPLLGETGLADLGTGLRLDGVDDGILLNNHSSLNTGSSYTQKTIELWFNADDTDGTQVIYEQGGTTRGLNVYLDGGSLNMGAWNSHSGDWFNTDIFAGQTYHVVLVFDAGTLSGYINGSLIGTVSTGFSAISGHSDTGAISHTQGQTRLSNSLTSTDSNYFAGTIDNVALYNSALSAEQVATHYDARSQNLTGGTSDSVLIGGSGDDALTGDVSKQGLNLDGIDDYVEIASSTGLSITNAITVETWIKVDSFTNQWQAIVTKGDQSWRLHRNSGSNVLNFALGRGGGRSVTGQTNVNDGQWHHVAATFDGEYVRLYVNGQLDGERYSPGAIPQTSHRVLLGANDQRAGRNFDGQLDDVQLWDVARTQAEIQSSMEDSISGTEAGLVGYWNFEAGSVSDNSIVDLTGNGYQGTLLNGQDDNFVAEVAGGNDTLIGGAGHDQLTGGSGNDTLIGDDIDQTLSLDGTNDYVAVTASNSLDLNATGTFTLETQLYSTATDNGFHGIMGYHPGSLQDRYPGMWIVNKTGIHFGFGDGVNWYHHTVNNVLTEGDWNHVAMTFDGTSFKLYVDAQEVFSSDAYAGKIPNTTQQIEIGKASGYYFEGQLDNVGVWNVARTDTEIQESMNAEVTGLESGLVGYWTFNKSTIAGNEISDLSGNSNTGTLTNGQGDNFTEITIGNDLLEGGNDLLEGGAGNDELMGNAGDDDLSGQAGNDTLTGGAGADRYVFESVTDGVDVITDFDAAEGDRIFLTESFGATTLDLLSFDGATGALSYDGVQFATLQNVASLDIYTAVESALYTPVLISVEEHAAVDSVLGSVAIANPAIDNAYAIISGNDDGIFTIDANTGELSVADEKQLDYEIKVAHPLEVEIVDSAGNVSTTDVLVTVTDAVNEAPLLDAQGFVVSESVDPGAVLGTVVARDDDGDSFTFEIVAGNDDGLFELDGATGELTLADDAAPLNYETADRHEFQVRVTDAVGNSRDESIQVIVDGNPLAAADTFATDQATVISGDLLADNGNGADADPEEGAVTITEVNGYAFEAGLPTDIGSLAQVTVNTDGSFDYDPNGRFEYLAAGETTTDSFSYTVQDEAGGTDTATVTVEISGVNDAPVAVADEFDALTSRTFSGNLLASNGLGADYDVDESDQIVVSEVWMNGAALSMGQQATLASGALLTVNSDGSFDYDPNGQVVDGSVETFDYVVSDGTASSQMVTATINVAEERVIDLTDVARDGDTRGFVINGSQAEAYAGFSVSMAGDINGDGYGDFIIGAPKTDGGVVEVAPGTDLVVASGSTITSSFLDLDWEGDPLLSGSDVYISSLNGTPTRDGTVEDGDEVEVTLASGATIKLGFFVVLSSSTGILAGDFTYTPPSSDTPLEAGESLTDSFYVVFKDTDGNDQRENFTIAVTGGTDVGASYVVFGKEGSDAIELSNVSNGENGFVIASETNSSSSGFSVSGGRDINGDNRPDILIGAPSANSYAGDVYTLFTPENNFSNINLAGLAETTNGLSFSTGSEDQLLGYSSALADVNGNGIADVIMSAPRADDNEGRVYVVFDQIGNEPVDLSTLEQTGRGFLIDGTWETSKGRYLDSAGDVNNDGYEDIILGHGAGNNRVVFGKADSSTITLNGGASGSEGDVDFVSINSPYRTAYFNPGSISYLTASGRALSGGGDINGDGISDVIAAEDDLDQDYVEFTVLFGKEDFKKVNLDDFSGSSVDGFQIRKDLPVYWGAGMVNLDVDNPFNDYTPDVYGAAHAAKRLSSDIVGDVNGDGLDDIAFSVNTGSSSGDGFGNDIYVIFGKRDGLTIDLNQALSPDDGFLINVPLDYSGKEEYLSSFEAKAAGDVNGDGLADIIIGAPFNNIDDAANDNAGKSYILFGADYTNSITHQGTEAADTLTGTIAAESFIGGFGNDTLTGGGGADVLYGGAGDDRIAISDTTFQRIDGGAGTDTLAVDGSDITLDIADVRGLIRNVEHIDLTGSGDNSLNVILRDLVNLSDTSNRLIVTGDAGDQVISVDQDWSRGSTEVIDGRTFNTYTKDAAELFIDSQVTAAISATFPDQSFSLVENSAAGTIVGEIEVESVGNNIVDVAFTDASSPFSTEFDANLQKWIVKVQDPSQLDFESGSLINLEMQATDSLNLTSTAVFSFNLSDINEAPEFDSNPFSFAIAEHSAIGSSIGFATATDQDADNVLTYSIIGGNDANIFAIDSTTGEITVAKAAQLDYESQASHGLTVRATDQDGLLQDTAVTIDLTDQTTLTYNSSLAFNITDVDTDEQYTAIASSIQGYWDDNISPVLPSQTNWSGADANESYAFWSNLDLSSGSLNADLPIDVQILMPDGIAPGQQFLIRSAAKLQDTATLEASSPGVDFEIGMDLEFSLDAGLELPSILTNISDTIPDTLNLLTADHQDHFIQGSFVLNAPTLESETASVDTASNSLSTQLINQDWATVEANLSTSELNLWEAAFDTLGIPTEVEINAGEFGFTLDTVSTLQAGSPVASAGSYGGNPSVSWTEEDGWTTTYTYTDSDYLDNITWRGDLMGGEIVINYKESFFNQAFNGGVSLGPLEKLETVMTYTTFDPSLDPRLGLSQYLNLDLNNLEGTIVFTEMLADGYSLAESSATFDSQFIDGDFTSENLATSLITVPVNADVNGDGVVEFETFVAPVVDLTNYTELDFALDYALKAGEVNYATTMRLDFDMYESMKDNTGTLWQQVYQASENPKVFVNNYGSSNDYWELTYNSGSIAPTLDIADTIGAGLPLVMATTPDIEQSQAFGGGTQAAATTSFLIAESDTTVTGSFSLGLDENGNAYDPATFTFTLVGGDTQALEYGSIINNNDGTFTFSLNDELDFLSEGDYEDVSFQYSATNGTVTQTRDVTLIVEGETDYTALTAFFVEGTNSGEIPVGLILLNGALDTTRSTYVVTHGWRSDALEDGDWTELLESVSSYAGANFAEGANVIFADWTSAADNLNYLGAAEDTEKVGDAIATQLHDAGIDPTTTTLIGHSLGSHVSGNIGEKWQSLSGSKVDLIIGLDPAGPEFESGGLTNLGDRLDASDANRVVAFHSTAALGYDDDLGHVDLYLNEWDNLVIPQPGQSSFVGDHSYPIELLAQLYQGQTFTQDAASAFSQAFGSASFDASDLTAAASGSFDITTYAAV